MISSKIISTPPLVATIKASSPSFALRTPKPLKVVRHPAVPIEIATIILETERK